MPRPRRSTTIRPDTVSCYHVWSRCVRRLRLTQDPTRKDFMVSWLRQLHEVYAVEVCRYAIMGNHFHLIVRVNTQMAADWSAREAVRRWAVLHPPRTWGVKKMEGEALDFWISSRAADAEFVASVREKLASIPQFMKEFKQRIAQGFNLLDKAVGAFWQGRYGCAALDSESKLLSSMVYVDLNPHAAGIGELPEDDPHTSLHAGMASRAQVRAQRKQERATPEVSIPARSLSAAQVEQTTGDERQHAVPHAEKLAWTVPVARGTGHARRGLLEGVAFEDYLRLVDFVARKLRHGKAKLDDAVAGILERAQVMEESLWRELGRLLGTRRDQTLS